MLNHSCYGLALSSVAQSATLCKQRATLKKIQEKSVIQQPKICHLSMYASHRVNDVSLCSHTFMKAWAHAVSAQLLLHDVTTKITYQLVKKVNNVTIGKKGSVSLQSCTHI